MGYGVFGLVGEMQLFVGCEVWFVAVDRWCVIWGLQFEVWCFLCFDPCAVGFKFGNWDLNCGLDFLVMEYWRFGFSWYWFWALDILKKQCKADLVNGWCWPRGKSRRCSQARLHPHTGLELVVGGGVGVVGLGAHSGGLAQLRCGGASGWLAHLCYSQNLQNFWWGWEVHPWSTWQSHGDLPQDFRSSPIQLT